MGTGIRVSVDHVACIPYLGEANDVAVRWSLTALHAKPSTTFGDDFTETPIYILGSSHFRIMRGKIREEWTMFDELAIHRQIATKNTLAKLLVLVKAFLLNFKKG